MKNVLILEDDSAMQDVVEKLLLELDTNITVYKISTLPEAYQVAVEHIISLFVVGIILDHSIRNDVSGLKFIEKIRQLDQYAFVPVIFISSLTDPELYAYRDLHCYGYLGKPLLIEEAKPLLSQALRYQQPVKEDGTVFFRKDGVIYAVNKKDIVYIKSHGGVVTIKTVKNELTVYYRNCKDILRELDSGKFVQSNRGTIVNKEFIENVDPVNRIIRLSEEYGTIEMGTLLKKSFMENLKDE